MPADNQNLQQLTWTQRFRRLTRPFRRWFASNSAWCVLVLAIGTALSAFLGTAIGLSNQVPVVEGESPTFLNWLTDAIYESAQVVFLNMDAHSGEFNFFIGLARVGAVVLAIVVAIEAIRRLFKNSLEHLRISYCGDGLVFVAGLGRIGLEVACDRVANNDFVVVLELTEENHWTDQAEEDGILVKQGDVNHSALLKAVVAKNPREYFLVTGEDQTNINALARVASLRRDREQACPGSVHTSDCYVHIDDPALYSTLCRTLAENQKAGTSDSGLTVHYFNICHETACELIVKDLTQLRPTQSDDVALYVVFGFDQMGQAMVKELVEFAHFENQRRPRILVITNDPASDADRCLARWPRMSPRFVHEKLSSVTFSEACDNWDDRSVRVAREYQVDDENAVEYAANVHFCKLAEPGILTQSEVASIAALAQADRVAPVVLFCNEDDEVNFKMASELNDLLSDFHGINRVQGGNSGKTIPCRVFMPRSRPLRQMLEESSEARFLYPFGSVSEGISRVQDTLIEDLGMVFAWAYDKHAAMTTAKQQNQPDRLSEIEKIRFEREQYLATWQSKEYWDRYSNCAAAEHAWIKMQILGLQLWDVTRGDPRIECVMNQFRIEKRSLLGYVEHNRWLAERLLMGWSYGERSDTPPRRPSMCAKRTLSGDELDKDFAQIRAMCEYIIQKRSKK